MDEDRNRNRGKKINYDENIINGDNSENENEYDCEYEYFDYEYNEESINIIQKNLLEYVELKYLPLCEYLSLEKISKFVLKIIN